MKQMEQKQSAWSNFIVAAGVILAVSYPILAISTGFRAGYQLFEGDPTNSPWLSLLAALCYITATVGFAKQPREGVKTKAPRTFFGRIYQNLTPQQAWRISVYVLIFESTMTLVIGTLSFIKPDVFGRNVWDFFGRDYGYFPLVQPLLGIAWLFNTTIMRTYKIRT